MSLPTTFYRLGGLLLLALGGLQPALAHAAPPAPAHLAAATSLEGYVFEDVNYAGGNGRANGTAGTGVRAGVRVELYKGSGSTATFFAATLTGPDGRYAFGTATTSTAYTVRVVNSTVGSNRTGYVAGLLPVQTWNGATAVGGANPVLQDAGSNLSSATLGSLTTATATAESVKAVTTGTGTTSVGPDFGFNFDVIVNTNDAGQGSLRQFILNANALGDESTLDQSGGKEVVTTTAAGGVGTAVALPSGTETSIFMIPIAQLSSQGVAVITVATALPQLTGPGTSINGATQTNNIGNRNNVALGSGGPVGSGPTATLWKLNGPEVRLSNGGAASTGLDFGATATNSSVRGLAVYGFGDASYLAGQSAQVRAAGSGFGLRYCVLGSNAYSFADPNPSGTTLADGLYVSGNGASIGNSLLGYATKGGVVLSATATGASIGNSELTANGRLDATADAVTVQGGGASLAGNRLVGNYGPAIDVQATATTASTIASNTIGGNGAGTTTSLGETAGVQVAGAGGTVQFNVIGATSVAPATTGNYGPGVLVLSTGTATISQNNISANGTIVATNGAATSGALGIDLSGAASGQGDGVTLNDNGDPDAGGNGLLNFPVLTAASLTGPGSTTLTINGYARPGALLEFYLPAADPTGFGEGSTLLGSATEGSSADLDGGTGPYGPGAVNGLLQGTDNTSRFTVVLTLTTAQVAALQANGLTGTATLGGATSEFAGNLAFGSVAGTVFEDKNYGGGSGRDLATANAVASNSATLVASAATVELYDAAGTYLATTATASGKYTFNASQGSYTVRVLNATVRSTRANNKAGLLPVQTYNGSTTRVGGEDPTRPDAGAGSAGTTLASLGTSTTVAQSVAAVQVGSTATTGPDFGFNFDLVVNTNDAGQGSLRQFILNANTLGGETALAQSGPNVANAAGVAGTLPVGRESSIFMIADGQAHPGLLAASAGGPANQLTAGGVAAIVPATALPAFSGGTYGTLVTLDGTTQTANIGNTNNVTLGSSGTQVNGPEIRISNGGTISTGLSFGSGNVSTTYMALRGVAVYGFGDATYLAGTTAQVAVGASNPFFAASLNVLGTTAISFSDAGSTVLADGLYVAGQSATISNNLIGYNTGSGLVLAATATKPTIGGNELAGNGRLDAAANGLVLRAATATISGNRLADNAGAGLDMGSSSNTVTGNTVTGNGRGTSTALGETAGIQVNGTSNNSSSTGNTIASNVITGNYGPGILALSYTSNTTFSQNSLAGNGTVTANTGAAASGALGIDLSGAATGQGDGVTLNDSGDPDAGANGLLNYPVLTAAKLAGTNLVVSGYARPYTLVEFFVAAPDPSGFGEGQTYLGSATESSSADQDTGNGSYGPGAVSGLVQGSDISNKFTFSIALSAAQIAALQANNVITSTGTSTASPNTPNPTSEFSGNFTAGTPVLSTVVTGPVQLEPGLTYTYTVTYANNSATPANDITATVTLPSGSSNATAAGGTVAGNTITFGGLTALAGNASQSLTFSFTPPTPPATAPGTATNPPTPVVTTYPLTSSIASPNPVVSDQYTLTLNVAGAPLPCNSAFYRVRTQAPTALLERLDRTSSAGTITYVGTSLYSAPSLNALAFNYADGYLYGFEVPTNILYRLSSNGYQNLGAIAGLPTSGFNAATSDLSGNVYLANGATNTIYKLNISTLAISTLTLSQTVNFGDMAYNRLDGNLYAVRYYSSASGASNGLSQINPTTGVVTVLNGAAGTTGDDVGSIFFDAAGSLYAATNQGNFVAYNTTTGVSTLIGTASSASQSDGASCVFPTQQVDVVLSAAVPVRVSATAFDVTYTAVVKNTGVSTATNVQLTDFLNDGSNGSLLAFPGATLTVVAAPTVTSGPALATNGGFNGTSSTGLLAGSSSLASGASSTLTYTVRVAYASAAAIPTTAQNNSLYASTTPASSPPNPGFSISNGIAVPPSLALAGDMSTNGPTPPTVANADTPSPTPVTFLQPLAVADNATTPLNTAVTINAAANDQPGVGNYALVPGSIDLDPSTPGQQTSITVAGGTFALLTSGANAGQVLFTPTTGFAGTVATPYTISDTNGGISNQAALTVRVVGADVTTVVSGPTQLAAGQPSGTYTATFANVGGSPATQVTRTVTVPAGATFTTAQLSAIAAQGGAVSGTTIDFGPVSSLAAGASTAFTFGFVAPAATGAVAVVSNTSTTSSEFDNVAPNSSTLNATVYPIADVAATITPVAGTVTAGQSAGFDVTFADLGGQPAAGIAATVQLSAGLTAYGPVSVTTSSGTASYDNATGLVTYAPASTTLSNGAPLTSTITFTAPPTGPVVGTATVQTSTDEAGATANNTAAASIAVSPAFDLTTTIGGPASATAGNEVILNVTTTNNGPSPAPSAMQTVQLAKGLADVFVSGNGRYDSGTGLVTFPALATLPGGQTVSNSISFTAPAMGTVLAPVALVAPTTTGAGDTNPNNNTAYLNGAAASTDLTSNAATTDQANAYTTLSTSTQSVVAGRPVTLTVVAGNAGPKPATDVTERLQLPAGLAADSLTVGGAKGMLSGGTLTFGSGTTSASYDVATGLLTFPTVATLASGGKQTYTVAFQAPATGGSDGQLLLTASVMTSTSETVLSDNVASVGVVVRPTADVATTLSGPATATAGQPVSYTATFANNGPGTATGVTRTVQLPAGLGAVATADVGSGSTVAATYNATTGVLTLPALASETSGSAQAYAIAFAAPAASFGVNSSTGAGTPDARPANNRASVPTSVGTVSADVAVAVSGPVSAVVGNPVTYFVNTTNNGPAPASGVASTLQLPAGLAGVAVSNGGSYDTNSGLVTFTSAGTLASGASVADYVTFTMPNPSGGQLSAVALATSTGPADLNPANNTARTATSVAQGTPTSADLATTVSVPASATAGSSVTVSATFSNNGPNPASGVAPSLQLPAGLSITSIGNGGSYHAATGVVTWPLLASQASGSTGSVTYSVVFAAPATGPLTATSSVSASTNDPAPANNVASGQTTIGSSNYDAVTSLGGPGSSLPGATNTYTVTASNQGPAVAPQVQQTVTLPSGVMARNISGGGTQSGTVITWPAIANQAVGSPGAVSYTFDVVMPTSGNLALAAKVTASGESNTANNGATLTTTRTNRPPLAANVVNTLPSSANGDTAGPLPISPLAATDADGAVGSYQVLTLPDASQGVLYYNNGSNGTSGTYVALPASQPLTPAQAGTLRFDPVTGFVGNAFFTYAATDNLSAVGNTALYTLPVGRDGAAGYQTTPTKTDVTLAYQSGDVLAYVVDANGASYNSGGSIYNANTGKLVAPSSTVSNGLATSGTNAVLTPTSGAGSAPAPAGNASNALPSGTALNPSTGQLYVTDPTQLPQVVSATSYTVNITTTDLHGGITTQAVTIVIGGYPLPVELTAFDAKAAGPDARLTWLTASELNNDRFEVERSFDGRTFAYLGRVAGHGSKLTPTSYGYLDAGVGRLHQQVYYRLRQVDFNGTSAYSGVRAVSFAGGAAAISLYPNPATASTTLDLTALPAASTYQVLLLDATGRQVRSFSQAGSLAQRIDLSGLATGTYNVLVTGTQADGSLLRQVLRLTKE